MPVVSPEEWRARAQVWVPLVINANPGITDIDKLWEAARDTALYVPREYFREAVRGYHEEEVQLKFIDALGEQELLPRRWFREGYTRMPENYRYVVETTGVSTETGEIFSRSAAFDSPFQLTKREIYDRVIEEMPDSGPAGMEPGFTMQIIHAFHRTGARW